VVAAAANRTGPQLGRSGMKMDGPYDYVPPNYWYGSQLGAAFGFAGELSAGPGVPELDALKAMLSPAEQQTLWQNPGATQYHAGTGQFNQLRLYGNAIQNRYGKPTSLEDFVRKAQLTNYENIRAQYEANIARMDRASNPATGLVYWMLNNGWPSLIWHLYDHSLAPSGGSFGAKKANRPLHVLWQYESGTVTIANNTAATASGLSVTAETYSLDGTRRFTQTVTDQSVASLRTKPALTVPKPTGVTGAYLVKLVMKDASGAEIDRNVYWWSTKVDVLNWGASDWYYTPVSSYADLTGITKMAAATVSSTASTTVDGDTATTTVKLTNTGTGPVPAFFVEATLRDAKGAPVAPVSWSDNAVSLWPGESLTLTATSKTGSAPLTVDVSGINVAKTSGTPVR
jgi:exo-1,4-beta-D-glucosaminidase